MRHDSELNQSLPVKHALDNENAIFHCPAPLIATAITEKATQIPETALEKAQVRLPAFSGE